MDQLPDVITCSGVTKTFRSGSRDVAALRGVDLAISTGSWVAITGASGCGKSTFLQLLGGLDTPDGGSIVIAGEPIERLSETARALLRRRRIGFVFQFFNLISNLTVAENVELPMLLVGTSRRAARARSSELLTTLGIADLAGAAPSELSGGQQQRVAMARALANKPDVLLADEPTGNLDSVATQDIIELLRRTHRSGQTIIMVTHDPDVAAVADRVLVMADGRIVDDTSKGAATLTGSARR